MSDDDDSFHGITWRGNDARLKTYSTAMKAGSTLVKIELEVTDPFRLSVIMQSLEEARADQAAKAKAVQTKAGSRQTARRAVSARPAVPLLTFRGDD